MLAIAILSIGILSRLIAPIPNFNPVIALALFSGVYIKDKRVAVTLPLILMLLSDVFIGFHSTIAFTWASMIIIAAFGLLIRDVKNVRNVVGMGFVSAVFFFIVTNLGVWLMDGMYPMTREGLAECFVMALPFFRMTMMSTLIYTGVFFGLYEVIAARVKQTRFAHVL